MAVVDSIFAHARTTPDKTAVIYNGRTFSYRIFAACIARARIFLDGQALSRDRVAALCIHAVLEAWIIGLALRNLGVTTVHCRSVEDIEGLGLGAVSVVSNELEADAWPGLKQAATEAGAPLTMAPAALYADAAAVKIGEEAAMAGVPPGGHILLTSGTTGSNKKVLIDAAVEAWNLKLRRDFFGLSSSSVVNMFDMGGWTGVGYHLPACVWELGGTAVIHQGPEPWRSLAAPGLTMAFTWPQLLADLLATPSEIPLRNDAVMLIVAGGAMSQTLWRMGRERLTDDVRNCFGATETGPVAMTPIRTADDLIWHRIAPASQVEVVDEYDQPVPAGTTGNVRIRTTGVGGYLNDPAATHAFFRDSYFYPGDLGVMRDDGRLSLQGRVTDVINVMGEKIAPAPIETALRDRLGAEEVCVFSHPGGHGEVVHVVVQPGRTVTPADLQAALHASLPGGTPVRVHAVKAFPRNHMGKIERAATKAQVLSQETPRERQA